MYTALYMTATRTQVYLTPEQREKVDELMRREHLSLASIIRQALDAYLAVRAPDRDHALESTFGVLPELVVPGREEWERG
jgi:hypothetical protein